MLTVGIWGHGVLLHLDSRTAGPLIQLLSGNDVAAARSGLAPIMGGGIGLEARLQVVQEIFQSSE